RCEKLLERALVEARADMTDRHELAALVDAEEQGAEGLRPATLALRPATDDALHRAEGLDLHPRRGAPSHVRRVEAFCDDPLDPLLLRRLEQPDAGADVLLRAPDRAHRGQDPVTQPLTKASVRTPSHFGSNAKSGESNGSSAVMASIGPILASSGWSLATGPCLIISQSRPSFCFVFTSTHSPSRRFP